jgi:hypothetical protein
MQQNLPSLGYFKKRKFTKFYRKIVGNADLAFVFGEQTGHLTEVLSHIGVKTVVIQPIASFFEKLAQKFSQSNRVVLLKEDVGAMATEFYYNGIYEKEILPFSSNLSADENQTYIKITTFDELIARHGMPALCYIKGEGFENELLKGLNVSPFYVIFTFYSFTQEKTAENIRRLLAIGNYEFNWIAEDDPKFINKSWMNPKELHHSIFKFSNLPFSGEVFARLKFSEDEI